MSLNNNTYATKKTIAQGMLDIALLTANASQLRYILQVGPDNHEFYTPMLVMLISSMSLQALNGLAQLIMGPLDIDKDEHKSFLNVVSCWFLLLTRCLINLFFRSTMPAWCPAMESLPLM